MTNYYVFFTDEVVSSAIETHGVLTEGMQVEGNPEQYLFKTYDNGVWNEAPVKRIGILSENKEVIYIYDSYFTSHLNSDHVVLPENVELGYTLDNGSWLPPVVDEQP
jgi:hypothetical protein